MKDLAPGLQQRREQQLYRSRKIQQGMQGVEVVLDGKSCLAFCSNDYLGLSHHPDVIRAFKKGADHYGVGSGAAHLINGHSKAHHALEEELADFVGYSRALLFSTGYMANLGVMSALLQRGDAVLQDRLNHASLMDAGLLSGATLKRFEHQNFQQLSQKLQQTSAQEKLIASDGVFSMDGDIADLPKLALLAKKHQAWLMIDDAHGLGVLGKHGGGTLEYFSMSHDDVPVLMGTLGKAFGCFGAFVAGSEALVETLINQARSYIYTTALPSAIAEATRASLKLIREDNWRRDRLNSLIAQFRKGANELGLEMMPSETPVQPLMLRSSEKAMQWSELLWEQGIYIPAIRPPTVPQDSARLRISFSADHDESHVIRLLDALENMPR